MLRDGTLQQCATPQDLFRHPVNAFVGAFIGSPSMNFVHATIERGILRFADVELPLSEGPMVESDGRTVILGIRPTGFTLPGDNGWPTMTASPRVVEDLGDERFLVFDVDAPAVDTEATRAAVDARTSDDVTLLAADRARFTARLPADHPVTIGQPVELAIDTTRLYFFDPETGVALA